MSCPGSAKLTAFSKRQRKKVEETSGKSLQRLERG
jgi:hypothetical protein